ncbi:MAG: hypothetical protein MJZ34_05160 [Paludibacteraceae bacterium]|nr:hypothetical protein [Paludibacteraceae bacterium]
MVTKYIYFAGNNMLNHPLYKQSFILGETDNLVLRQEQYNKLQKGVSYIECGDLMSYDNRSGLYLPFVDVFKFTLPFENYTKNKHDKYLHEILKNNRPFTDFVYHLDKKVMNTVEGFGFYNVDDFMGEISRIKDYLIEYLTEDSFYKVEIHYT